VAVPDPKEIELDPRVSVLVTVRFENVPVVLVLPPPPDTNAVPFWVRVPVKLILENVDMLYAVRLFKVAFDKVMFEAVIPLTIILGVPESPVAFPANVPWNTPLENVPPTLTTLLNVALDAVMLLKVAFDPVIPLTKILGVPASPVAFPANVPWKTPLENVPLLNVAFDA